MADHANMETLQKICNIHAICTDIHYKQYLASLIDRKDYAEMHKILACSLKFTTGGIRSKIANGLSNINEITINIITTALIDYLQKNRAVKKAFIGYDGRYKSSKFAHLVCQIMHKYGIEVHMTPEPVISPLVPFAVTKIGADVGVMITASHNDKTYNGMKIWMHDGYQICKPHDQDVTKLMQKHKVTKICMSKADAKNDKTDTNEGFATTETYAQMLVSYADYIASNVAHTKKEDSYVQHNNKILFSSLFGASHIFVQKALQKCNLDTSIVYYKPHCTICPDFGNMQYPNPELHENYTEMLGFADQNQILYAVMTDPDGDRFCLSQKIDSKWKIYDADEIAAIFAYFYITKYDKNKLVFINTYYCNDMLQTIAECEKIEHYKTETGFKHIAQKIKEVRTKSNDKIFFAYEDALGFLHAKGTEKDAIASAVIIAQLISTHKCMLSILQTMYRRYGTFCTFKRRYRMQDTDKQFQKIAKTLDNCNVVGNRIELQLTNDIFVIFRASETESMIKMYAKGKNIAFNELQNKVNDLLQKIDMEDK